MRVWHISWPEQYYRNTHINSKENVVLYSKIWLLGRLNILQDVSEQIVNNAREYTVKRWCGKYVSEILCVFNKLFRTKGIGIFFFERHFFYLKNCSISKGAIPLRQILNNMYHVALAHAFTQSFNRSRKEMLQVVVCRLHHLSTWIHVTNCVNVYPTQSTDWCGLLHATWNEPTIKLCLFF